MKMRQMRVLCALLALLLAVTGIVWERSSPGMAANETMIGRTMSYSETPKYLLIRPYDNSAWDSSWNDLHYMHPVGKPEERYVAYCLESGRSSPSGQSFAQVSIDFSAAAERGLKTIFRLGYPYHSTFGDNGEYTLNAIDAQAATQIAIRFWMAYRQTIDTDKSYHIIRALNPYGPNVRAADSDAARRVYNAALWLFHRAEQGYAPTFGVALSEVSSAQPLIQGENRNYSFTVRVSTRVASTDVPCDFAKIESVTQSDPAGNNPQPLTGATVTRQRNGREEPVTDGVVADGDVVTFTWPAGAGIDGRRITVGIVGYSDAVDITLRYMGTGDSSVQKLFVTTMEEGAVARASASVVFEKAVPPSPTPTPTNTPTPTPTNTPTPTPTNTPTPTPTNTPTPTPTNTPTPTPTNTPTPTPTNTPTPTPTNTPTPTPTNTPTPTPTNTPTPTPTHTPTPTNTPTPTPTSTPPPTPTNTPVPVITAVLTTAPIPTPVPTQPSEVKSAGPPESPQTGEVYRRERAVRLLLFSASIMCGIIFVRGRRRG